MSPPVLGHKHVWPRHAALVQLCQCIPGAGSTEPPHHVHHIAYRRITRASVCPTNLVWHTHSNSEHVLQPICHSQAGITLLHNQGPRTLWCEAPTPEHYTQQPNQSAAEQVAQDNHWMLRSMPARLGASQPVPATITVHHQVHKLPHRVACGYPYLVGNQDAQAACSTPNKINPRCLMPHCCQLVQKPQ